MSFELSGASEKDEPDSPQPNQIRALALGGPKLTILVQQPNQDQAFR